MDGWVIAGLIILLVAYSVRRAFMRKSRGAVAVRAWPTIGATPAASAPCSALPAEVTVAQSNRAPRSHRPSYEGGGTVIADNIQVRVLLRYQNGEGESTERVVSVARVRGRYSADGYIPEIFAGFCELRAADRFFMFGRVQAAFDSETGEEIQDLERYLVSRGNQRVGKVEFSMLTPEEASKVSRIEDWEKSHGRRRARSLFPPPLVTVEARGDAGLTTEFTLSVETVEQYGGRPFAITGTGKRIEKGARQRALRFTLQGFHTPEWEIASLRPDGATEAVSNVVDWLSEQGRRPKRSTSQQGA